MLLKSIKLENIRTYEKELIEFGGGSTLLAGDIGSGKSSVLQSIEFCLFGLQKGEISGSDLLRHGSDKATVEMTFDLNGKEFVIGRELKRTSKGITQNTGFIQYDGNKESKSPSDLKAAVLEMLGYPQEYLTRNPIMFRYTVYTPQDDMKRILLANQQERLEIIRKIFDIDKYGRIRYNASSIIMKELRSRKREYQVQFSDIDSKIKEREEKIHYLAKINIDLDQKRIDQFDAERQLEEREQQFESISDQIKSLNELKQEYMKKKTLKEQKSIRINSLSRDLLNIEKRISELKTQIEIQTESIDYDENQLMDEKMAWETAKIQNTSNTGFLKREIQRLEIVYKKGICEFCNQLVNDKESYKEKIDDKNKILAESEEIIKNADMHLKNIEEKRQKLVRYNQQLILVKEREKSYNEYIKRKEEMEDEKLKLDKELNDLTVSISDLDIKLSDLGFLENNYNKIKQEINSFRNKREMISKDVIRLEQQIENISKEIKQIHDEIKQKELFKEKFNRTGEIMSWFEIVFIPLTEMIEKNVMSTIQTEFNQFFQQWFDVLIPGQSINVNVDDTFTPIIEQGGYQTEYQNLSGGEKTSVALAYRLALNKVINSMVESIKTKDLIILDEPTDGFSSDQLDRIRDVLNELNLKQMLIVSHEPKIDTYVDNVIRFYKEDNVSRVIR